MAASKDLWGEIDVARVRTPLVIMKEQAALLGTKTKNLVEASVKTRPDGEQFVHSFNIVVPALGNYTYNLFSAAHGPEMYPVNIYRQSDLLKNEEAFVQWLASKLSSPETKRIISNLLSQVAA